MASTSKINFQLPAVYQRPASVLKSEEFIPVIKSRRYNLLKLKEIYNHREKDKRLGRVATEQSSHTATITNQQVTRYGNDHYKQFNPDIKRRKTNKLKPRNNSYLNLMQKVRQNYRYCSLQR